MKRILIFAVLVLAWSCGSIEYREAPAMGPVDPDALVAEHPEFLDGPDYLCPTGPALLTAAPKGYEPFYISHYGRHGARYAWQGDLYDRIHQVLEKAYNEDNLTALGQDWRVRYESLYPSLRYRTGDLSRKGWEQQKQLAQRMYVNFPEVFEDDAYVRARTSTHTRCVMSMSSFCLGLKGENPKMEIFEDYGKFFLPAILPLDGKNPFREEYKVVQRPFEVSVQDYAESILDWKPILGRLFNEPDQAVEPSKQWNFVFYLYAFASGMNGIDTDIRFYDVFTTADRVAFWKIHNYEFWWYAYPLVDGYRPVVRDIIEQADARIASGQKGADLRFGHDYTLVPLKMLLDVDYVGHEVSSPDEVSQWSRTSQIPMGASIYFVFYRKGSDVLFKVLHNGEEATIGLETSTWPYYSWAKFKEKFGNSSSNN